MAVLSMSDRELRRLVVLQDLDRRRLTTAAATKAGPGIAHPARGREAW
jgi:hypothetical protein